MGKCLMAVCDPDEKYLNCLVEYIHENRKGIFEIIEFTGIDKLNLYSGTRDIDILLISDKEKLDSLDDIRRRSTVILSEEEGADYCYPSVNKYQSAERIIREVMEYSLETDSVKTVTAVKRIAGVFSPVNRCYKTTFAVVMGMQLAKTKEVLYLNLEDFSGFSELIETSHNRDLSDLIYYHIQNPKNLTEKLYSWTETLNGLDFINPPLYTREIRSVPTRSWAEMISYIASESRYEVIILDISNMLEDVNQIFDICTEIYMPVLEDFISISKIKEFENSMFMMGKEKNLEKIKKLKLPEIRGELKKERYFENLLREEFGQFVIQKI